MPRTFKLLAHHRIPALAYTLLILILGSFVILNMQCDFYATLEPDSVKITTPYPGASPEDVERRVTLKIENALLSMSGVDSISSVSSTGLSMIIVKIDPNSSSAAVRRELRERIGLITELPDHLHGPTLTETGIFGSEIIEVVITGNDFEDCSYADLRRVVSHLEENILTIRGVSGLEQTGYLAREIEVEVGPRALMAYRIPFRDVVLAIKEYGILKTGQAGRSGAKSGSTKRDSPVLIASPDEIPEILVRSGVAPVKVKDLAMVKDTFEMEHKILRVDGKRAISLKVFLADGAGLIRTAEAIRNLVFSTSANENTDSPVKVLLYRDASQAIVKRIRNAAVHGIICVAIIMLVLVVQINLTSALGIISGIPVTLAGVFSLLALLNSFHIGIALASLVPAVPAVLNSGIAVLDSGQRKSDTIRTIAASAIITFLFLMPAFLLAGKIGQVLSIAPLIIGAVMILSTIQATNVIPSMLAGSKKNPVLKIRWRSMLYPYCKKLMTAFIKIRYLVLPLCLALLVISLTYSVKYGRFSPSSTGSEEIKITIELNDDSMIGETEAKVGAVERILDELPYGEIHTYQSLIGKGDPSTGPNLATVTVNLEEQDSRNRKRSADRIAADLSDRIKRISGIVDFSVTVKSLPLENRLNGSVHIAGRNDSARVRTADRIEDFLRTNLGIASIHRNDEAVRRQIRIEPDYKALTNLGLSEENLVREVRTALYGETAAYLDLDHGEKVPVRVKPVEYSFKSLDHVYNPIPVGDLTVRLRDLARLEISPAPNAYYHREGRRVTTITFDLGNDGQKTDQKVKLLLNELTGLKEGGIESGISLVADTGSSAAPLNAYLILYGGFLLVVIYFFLALLLRSLTHPLTAIIATVCGVVGSVTALIIHGEQISMAGLIGMAGISGIILCNSGLLIGYLIQLKRKNPGADAFQLIMKALAGRSAPLLVAAVSTVAGLLPLAYSAGGIDSALRQAALASIYGLLTGTGTLLILVPCLYTIVADFKTAVKRQPALPGS